LALQPPAGCGTDAAAKGATGSGDAIGVTLMSDIWDKWRWQFADWRAQRRGPPPHELAGREPLEGFDREANALAATTELERLFWTHTGRLVYKWPHYLLIHQRYLGGFKTGFRQADGTLRPLRLLEIGVSHGGSLELWRRFLGPEAVIYGIDIDPRCAILDRPDLPVRIGSQADPVFLATVVMEMGGVDIVIDDGSHVAVHQQASIDVLLPMLSDAGLYIVEDIQTSYWGPWQGGYRRPGTFIELAKSIVDDMHGWYHGDPVTRPLAKTGITAVTFHDGIVVIEKGKRPTPVHVKMGTKSF
jgi:hypothetical protein